MIALIAQSLRHDTIYIDIQMNMGGPQQNGCKTQELLTSMLHFLSWLERCGDDVLVSSPAGEKKISVNLRTLKM